ncbi:ribose operon repressor [Bacillus sp. FJAT-27916]|uniref:LacI family DNA-binding transcriptional regulator n=1 Tax=Bacillus sp. FJAT-27916 TaxID=1679169 RepID=UPI0006717438|nr:LacI family DNA-binding transcriptional regulator [Bacillus sp. FJAT-27916]KMY44697.1 ribose operon repressor [Bacillus sp. FJAT-27916]
MTTIRDVAKRAGVSVATVSRYFNNGYVSEKAREKVEEAIASLAYQPSHIARSLSTKQTKAIGLIIPDIMNPFFPELARAVEDVAVANGYALILCNSDEQREKEKNYIETLSRKYVAGMILATSELEKTYYEQLNVPIVALDRPIGSGFPTVMTRNEEGAQLGTEFLIKQKARHIACLRGPEGLRPAEDRLKGFLKAISSTSVSMTVVPCPFEYKESEKIVKNLLQKDETIDAIFACSDISAIGAIKAAHSLGIRIPDQVQIMGFDGIGLGEMMNPSLATVAQNIYELGSRATEMLIKQIDGNTIDRLDEYVSPQLIIRESVKGASK